MGPAVSERLSPAELFGRFTLIVGEVNRGKTRLTQELLEAVCGWTRETVTVVDLAPRVPSSARKEKSPRGVGGRLSAVHGCRLRVFHRPLIAPRLQAPNEQEAAGLALKNRETISALFQEALRQDARILFVNDCTLYLQAGEASTLLGWIRSADTAVVNGYLGTSLGQGPLSVRERNQMQTLMEACDRLILL